MDPIDVGPLSISGYVAGTKAELEVTIGASSQFFFLSGGIRIADLDARVYVNASFQPTVTFDLKTDLKFSTHLTFKLEASLRKGSFTSMSGLKNLEFDIYVLLQQDILDYIVAQVNMQIMAAKHSVDDGIQTAQTTLDQAQKKFDADIAAAQAKVDDAKRKYDLKVAQVNGAFAAEKTRTDLAFQRLQQDLENAFKAFNGAVDHATRKLESARQNRENAIRNAQNDVEKAKRQADGDIDAHIRQVNNAKNDMQRRFGNALTDIQNAQNDVNRIQSKSPKNSHPLQDTDHCYEKMM